MEKHVGYLANLPLITQAGDSVNTGLHQSVQRVYSIFRNLFQRKKKKAYTSLEEKQQGGKKSGPCQFKHKPRCLSQLHFSVYGNANPFSVTGEVEKGIRPLKRQESSSVLSQIGEGLMYDFLLFSPLYIVSRQ